MPVVLAVARSLYLWISTNGMVVFFCLPKRRDRTNENSRIAHCALAMGRGTCGTRHMQSAPVGRKTPHFSSSVGCPRRIHSSSSNAGGEPRQTLSCFMSFAPCTQLPLRSVFDPRPHYSVCAHERTASASDWPTWR